MSSGCPVGGCTTRTVQLRSFHASSTVDDSGRRVMNTSPRRAT
ncbi:MAG TPA: hypothetical protein VFL86_14400 [Burkholderiaceae bacterium]|nr:hypothetical protein [Burkholderiaceae bacterium]